MVEINLIYDNVRLVMLFGSFIYLGGTVAYLYSIRRKTRDYQIKFVFDDEGNPGIRMPRKPYKS